MSDVTQREIVAGTGPLAALFWAGQAVITPVCLVSPPAGGQP